MEVVLVCEVVRSHAITCRSTSKVSRTPSRFGNPLGRVAMISESQHARLDETRLKRHKQTDVSGYMYTGTQSHGIDCLPCSPAHAED